MADLRIRLNRAGIRELCLSSEMRSALEEQAKKLADNANADARANVGHLHIAGNEFRREPYGVKVRGGRGTAVAFANTQTYVAAMNEARNKSLMKQLHG